MREKKKNSGVILWVKSWRMYFTFCDINKLFSRLWNYYTIKIWNSSMIITAHLINIPDSQCP